MLARLAARAALIGTSLANRSLFWTRAALGANALRLHDCRPDGSIAIGGVPEQLFGEGFLGAWHTVLGRELGTRTPGVLYEVGRVGGRWETRRAIAEGVWVPPVLRPWIGKLELVEKLRRAPVFHAVAHEALRIFLRMIIAEGGWGALEELDVRATPIRLVLSNAPETRQPREGAATEARRCSCDLTTGIAAGYFEVLTGAPVAARETTCRSRGDGFCTFEMTLGVAEPEAPYRIERTSQSSGKAFAFARSESSR